MLKDTAAAPAQRAKKKKSSPLPELFKARKFRSDCCNLNPFPWRRPLTARYHGHRMLLGRSLGNTDASQPKTLDPNVNNYPSMTVE